MTKHKKKRKNLAWIDVIKTKQRKHARRRVAERYGKEHTHVVKEMTNILKHDIRVPYFKIINTEKQSCSRMFYHVLYNDHEYKFIYSDSTNEIVTFYYLNDEDYIKEIEDLADVMESDI